MAVFSDSTEVYRYLGGLFRDAAADPVMTARFKPTGVVLKVNVTDPDASLIVDMPNEKVYEGSAPVEPTIELTMSADDGHRFWLGQLNMAVALARGRVQAEGPVSTLLKLIPMAKELFPRYREKLIAEGRADLLRAA
jgi:putative sterol carrier protein